MNQEMELDDCLVSDLVSKDYRYAHVLKKYKIDFCCGGKRKLSDVVAKQAIDKDELYTQLGESVKDVNEENIDFNAMPLEQLIDYILANHHDYIRDRDPLITEFAEKVARVHGEHAPETIQIFGLWKTLIGELHPHMVKEERILFPYIIQLEKDIKSANTHPKQAPFGSVKNPVSMMEFEHETAGEIINKIQSLSNNFTPPDWACNTYRILYSILKEFQDSLFKHVHLENNILFRKAIKIEEQLNN